MAEVSTKPYLIRALYEWCTDSGFTPHVAVAVDGSVRVPAEFVKNGEIVLNVSALATNRLQIGNDALHFQARFGGVSRDVFVPIDRVIAIYARENGQGMAFDVARAAGAAETASNEPPKAAEGESGQTAFAPAAPDDAATAPRPAAPGERPRLRRVK